MIQYSHERKNAVVRSSDGWGFRESLYVCGGFSVKEVQQGSPPASCGSDGTMGNRMCSTTHL